MGDWEKLRSPMTEEVVGEVPDCIKNAHISFLPAWDSFGGWCGDKGEYAPKLQIGFLCEEHQPERFRTDITSA